MKESKDGHGAPLATRNRHASVMLLCGLPGSGKSTSAKQFVSRITGHAHVDECQDELQYERVYLIDYDNITERLLQRQLRQTGQRNSTTGKREDTLLEQELDCSFLDSLVSCATQVRQDEGSKDNCSSTKTIMTDSNKEPHCYARPINDATFVKDEEHCYDSEHLRAWKWTRTVALKVLQRVLTHHFHPSTAGTITLENELQNILVLLDDNFYLKSMRHRVFQICQSQLSECTRSDIPCNDTTDTAKGSTACQEFAVDSRMASSCSFSVAFFNTPVEECKRRNANRRGRSNVPENVIDKMATSCEFPSAAKEATDTDFKSSLSCDRNVAILDSETDDVLVLDALRGLLHGSIHEPISCHNLQEEATLKAQKQRDREITMQNRRHRADVILRQLVGQTAKLDKRLARYANEARKSMLDQVKHQPPEKDDHVDTEEDVYSKILFQHGIAENFVDELVSKAYKHDSGSEIVAGIGGVEQIKQNLLKPNSIS
jgi:tRNA uridine 5-carbamoylmethylation protein Kti12